MPDSLDKKYYKIGDVAEMVGVTEATLRWWEREFSIIRPRRNPKGTRFYTPEDIEKVRIVKFLTKDKGLRLEAAREHLRANPDGILERAAVISRLREIRATLQHLHDSLSL